MEVLIIPKRKFLASPSRLSLLATSLTLYQNENSLQAPANSRRFAACAYIIPKRKFLASPSVNSIVAVSPTIIPKRKFLASPSVTHLQRYSYQLYQNENSLQAPANHRSGRVLSTSSKTCSPLPLWVNGSRQTIPVYGFQNGLPSKYFLPSVLKIFRKDGAPSPGCLLRIATANQSRLKVRFRLVK